MTITRGIRTAKWLNWYSLGLVAAVLIRIWFAFVMPVSAYWEEVALGFDAKSLWQTARDHHGALLPVVAMESFGDWKPPIYAYAAAPFVGVFGSHNWTVRMPAFLAGCWLVFILSLLVKELGANFQTRTMAIWLAALSPWGILFSRAAWEVNLAVSLMVTGVYGWLVFKRLRDVRWLMLSILVFGLCFYTYHAARLAVPILVPFLFLDLWSTQSMKLWLKWIKKHIWQVVLAGLLVGIVSWPLAKELTSNTVQTRVAQTSIFVQTAPIETAAQLKAMAGNTFWAKVIFARKVWITKTLLINSFAHLSPKFLFLEGDVNPRHSPKQMGQLYVLDGLLILLGLVFIGLRREKNIFLWIGWFWAAVIPAATTTLVPHALRSLFLWPLLIVLMTFGLNYLFGLLRTQWSRGLFLALYACQVIYFLFIFSSWYPGATAREWQYGYSQIMSIIQDMEAKDKRIYISNDYGRPMMYYWYYQNINPKLVQEFDQVAKKDQGEFLNFGNVEIISIATNYEEIVVPAIMAVTTVDAANKWHLSNQQMVYSPGGELIWVVGEKNE